MPEFTSYRHGTPCWTDVTSADLPRATLAGKNVAASSPPQQEGIPSHWTTYLASDDVDDTAATTDETVAKARELGGTALMPGMDLPEIGRLAALQDPTGAVFQVLQPPPE